YGVDHFQEERQQALLLRRRKRSRRRQTAHCAANLFGICRSRCRTAERPDGASSSRGHLTGIRPSRSTVDGSSAFRRLGCPEIEVAADEPSEVDELEQAQSALLGCWKDRQMVSRRLLAYDTTNFYTWTASTNQRNHLARRGHNKQGRHNLRQVGLSYVLDGEHGIS